MAAPGKLEDFPTVFAPQIEELHEFFKSREVRFGSAGDIAPVVERLAVDGGFRDEMASMVRAVIYRVRDGLSPFELLELLLVAIGGAQVDQAAEEIREPVRELLSFVQGVFRTRWNPGAARSSACLAEDAGAEETQAAAEQVGGPGAAVEASSSEASEPVGVEGEGGETKERRKEPPPNTSRFYRALMVAANRHDAEFADETGLIQEAERQASAGPGIVRLESPATIVDERIAPPADERDEGVVPKWGSWRWFWISLAGGLLLAVSSLLMLRHPGSDRPVPVKESGSIAAAPVAAPKPSPVVKDLQKEASAVERSGQTSQSSGDASLRVGSRGGGAKSEPASGTVEQAGPAGTSASLPEHGSGITRSTAAGGRGSKAGYGSRGTFGVSAGVMAARLVSAPEPEYPLLARITHVQGKVVVEAVIGVDGSVVKAKVISGHHLLRAAALQEVYQRQYRPYVLDDRPREVATLVTVQFRLHP